MHPELKTKQILERSVLCLISPVPPSLSLTVTLITSGFVVAHLLLLGRSPPSLQGSTGAREFSGLAARLLAALIADLNSGIHGGRSTAAIKHHPDGLPSSREARSAVARVAFQVAHVCTSAISLLSRVLRAVRVSATSQH